MKQNMAGFTLVELLITIAIMGIMAVLAIPAMSNFVNSTRVINRTEQIANLMRFAKAEAVRRNVPVVVCGVNIRDDGRPTGICDRQRMNRGIMAFADVDKNGRYDSTIDVNLRTININGNNRETVAIAPKIYTIGLNNTTRPAQDNVSEYVFMPNGTFGRKTQTNGFKNIALGQHYLRFQVSESGTLTREKQSRIRFVTVNPAGKIDVCLPHKSTEYEAPLVCQL